MDLEDVESELVLNIQYELSALVGAGPVDGHGETLSTLGAQFEALALCRLQVHGDAEKFRESLVRSGQARQFFLQRSKGTSRVNALGDSRGFLASLAGGSQALATDIARRSMAVWNPSWEYEDDFSYQRCLCLLALNAETPGSADPNQPADAFERALEGAPSLRLDVCRALLSADATAVVDALRALMEAEDAEVAAVTVPPGEDDDQLLYWANRAISIEGLGLLKLADLLGIRIDEALPRCPDIARLAWSTKAVRNLVAEVEKL